MIATVAWISVTPVKGLRLQDRSEVVLTEDGVPGDRAFFLVDGGGSMVSATRLGPLVSVECDHDHEAQTLELRFPIGEKVTGPIELAPPEQVRFSALTLSARPVLGAFSAALSDYCGTSLRLMATPPERPGTDRGRQGAVTLLSLASLERLREVASLGAPIDPRRFRMTFGVDGLDAHEEDHWIDRYVSVGEAFLHVAGNVGRCAVTTREPNTGVVDLNTLHHLDAYRGRVETTEPLPFGVYARVSQPGRVRLGDSIKLAGAT